jgi:NAD(P)-dependent dehydrogenase (short-subunit alcohol dehydrogenase family)
MSLSSELRAVVTGAGSGIGRGFSREIARRGGRVVAADVNLDTARETAAMLGAGHHAVRCDVSRLEEVEALAVEADKLLGGVDLVVNNAGVAVTGRVGEVAIGDWQWQLGVNLWGVIHGCHVFAPRLRRQRAGHIVNVASAAGFSGVALMGPYCVTKAGVISISETLAAELAPVGVGVTVLCPTFVKTNISQSSRGANEEMRMLSQKLMDQARLSPEDVARITLDCADRGRLYAVPMADARWLWRLKRWMPERFSRMATRMALSRARKHGVTIEI